MGGLDTLVLLYEHPKFATLPALIKMTAYASVTVVYLRSSDNR